MAALQGLEAKNDGPVLEIGVLQGLVAKNDVHFQDNGPFLGSPGQNIVNFQKKRCFLGSCQATGQSGKREINLNCWNKKKRLTNQSTS